VSEKVRAVTIFFYDSTNKLTDIQTAQIEFFLLHKMEMEIIREQLGISNPNDIIKTTQ
jgi:hypothetical protein